MDDAAVCRRAPTCGARRRQAQLKLARKRVFRGDFGACAPGRVDRVSEDTKRFILRDLTLDLCESNILPAVTTPRSLALAHLRTALWFHAAEPIDRFITMDASQE